MSYTYLITGATSDVGRALIERLLTAAPDATVLAQGCGDLAKLADLCARLIPARCAPTTLTCPTAPKSDTFVQVLAAICPRADAFHPPARTAGRQRQVQGL